MSTFQEIENLVIKATKLLAEDFDLKDLKQVDKQTFLYGNNGVLDSMALVNLIADIEDAVLEQTGMAITLADEKAMSTRNSPFLTVDSLIQAVMERLSA